MKKSAFLLSALLCTPLSAQAGDPSFVVAESGEGYSSLQAAVDAIGDGEGTIVIASGRYRQCAEQEAGSIAYIAASPGTVLFDGRACDGKAALVLAGRSARVEGLSFQNFRVSDKNGAGIRIERGDLIVTDSLFRDSENGILSASDPSGTIRIDRSTFSGLGGCVEDHGCSHSIYVGDYGKLVVTRSRFERGTGGHYVKSRAPVIELTESSFDDTAGRGTNYMVDLSNGATGIIAGNVFVQGRDKDNYSAFIIVAPEGVEHDSAGLAITDNQASIAPGVDRSTAFVADESGEALRIENNRLGEGIRRFEKR